MVISSMATLGEKIKYFRQKIGLKQEDLANALGKSKNVISNWERGDNKPDADTIERLCSILDVSPNILLNWNEPNQETSLPKAEQDLIQKYRLIDAHGKEAVDAILNIEYKQYEAALLEKEKQAAAKSAKKADPSYTPVQRHYPEGVIPLDSYHESDEYNDMITLPIYDAGASAGTGVFLDSTCYETAAMPNTHLTQRANFAVWVEGDSMEPRFHNGDLVLVRTQPTVDIGEIGIFVVNGEGFIKKLGENKLVSLNPEYEDIELNEYDEVYCKGKVLGRVQQILSEEGEY